MAMGKFKALCHLAYFLDDEEKWRQPFLFVKVFNKSKRSVQINSVEIGGLPIVLPYLCPILIGPKSAHEWYISLADVIAASPTLLLEYEVLVNGKVAKPNTTVSRQGLVLNGGTPL